MLFDQFTLHLYNLLKECHNGRDYEPGSVLEHTIEEALGDYERAEILKEPLPRWAIGRNPSRCITEGAQLLTRNGARIGNAHVMDEIVISRITGDSTYWDCVTESGNLIRLTVDEIKEQFTIGPYISDPVKVRDKYYGEQY